MSDDLAIIMVGLPATGKSFTARNLSRYLRWLGVETFTFSAAKYRQDMLHDQQIKAEFFDATNTEFLNQRTRIADATLADMVEWFEDKRIQNNSSMKVAVMDASNTIHERRRIIRKALESVGVSVIFIECIYETEGLLDEHLQFLHLLSPDYEHLNHQLAQIDYKQRIQYYRNNYAPVDECDGSFIKLINGGEQVILNQVTGFLPSKVIFYLMNLHFGHKKIYLQIIADEINSSKVVKDCWKLNNPDEKLLIWTPPDFELSTECRVESKTQLTSLNMANLEGLSEDQISELYPEEAVKRSMFPYNHRYPRCESYADLSRRLETTIMELERTKHNVLIFADISVIRCIYSYFVETSDNNVTHKITFSIAHIISVEHPIAPISTSGIDRIRPSSLWLL